MKSMKHSLFAVLSLLTAVFTVAAAAAVSLLYYRFYQDNVRQETRRACSLAAAALDLEAERRVELTERMAQAQDGRLTLVAPDGTVLFDSDRAPAALDNHAGRAEIAAARESGFGEITRRSDTFGAEQYYCAARLEDGAVIRLSRRVDRIAAVFGDTVPLTGLLIVALIAASLAAASLLTKAVLRPVSAAAASLDGLLAPQGAGGFPELTACEELSPFLQKLRALRGELDDYIRSLREERDTIGTITQNMREGLILLDSARGVLTLNAAAVRLTGAGGEPKDYEGQNVLRLCRSPRFTAALEEVEHSAAPASFTEKNAAGSWNRFLLSPAGAGGALALIVDVTTQMQAEQVRRDFAANVSHELKTPLTSIAGFAEMIAGGMIPGEEDVRTCAARIHREAARMIALVSDIIRLSQIESGSAPEDEVCFLGDIAREALQALEPAAREKQVTLTGDIDSVILTGGRAMLYELVYNLLDNAVCYNRPGGLAALTVRREGESALILVSDTGLGIPPEDRERIFERFYRVDKSRSKRTGGTGLGLSIVKHIVERLGGTITVDSAVDEGTVMTVSLPVR